MTDTHRDDIRAEMRRRRAGLSQAEREQAASAVCHRLLATHFYRAAYRIGAYLATGDELDLSPVIKHAWQQGKQVCVPVISSARQSRMEFAKLNPDTPLLRNRYDIDEPDPSCREIVGSRWLDLVLVPLVAFDRLGNRMGMGGGYYDRCFSFLRYRSHWIKPRLCGVAFTCQEADRIESAAWDVPLTCVVTSDDLVRASRHRNRDQK